MARQILCGLNHLHANYVLHRDIKSMNILVTENFVCKITDFGMSKLITDDLELFNTANAGTPLWMAPEVKAGVYGFAADVFSTGLVIFEVLEEKLPPWDKLSDRIILPDNFYFKRVVCPLACQEPTDRVTAKQALELFDTELVTPIVANILQMIPDPPQLPAIDNESLQRLYDEISQQKYDLNSFLPNRISL